MNEDMRGLFFIVKGQYKRGVEPSYTNTNGGVSYIGGYDPYNDTTEEWYMLIDNRTFQCHCSTSDLNKVLDTAFNIITRNKGNAKRYFKAISEVPYGVSRAMSEMRKHTYEEFGDFYRKEIKEVEDRAYGVLRDEKPINKARKLVSKNKSCLINKETPKEVVLDTKTPKLVTPKVKLGMKKLV